MWWVAIPLFLGALTSRKKDSGDAAPVPEFGPGKTMKEFFKWAYPIALRAEKKTGVPALVIVGQAALESAYGKIAPGNMYFGVKATKKYKGKTQKLKTWECGKTGDPKKDGITDEIIMIYPPGSPQGNANCNAMKRYSYRVMGLFRAYDSAEGSFIDHGQFLIDNPRYKKAFDYKNDPYKFALEVAKAGYSSAGAEQYYKILSGVMDKCKKVIAGLA